MIPRRNRHPSHLPAWQTGWRRASWALLVLALVGLQQLGLLHRYAHTAGLDELALLRSASVAALRLGGDPPAASPASALAEAGNQTVSVAAHPAEALGWPAHGQSFCLVLDQLCVGEAPLPVPLAWGPAPAQTWSPVASLGWHGAGTGHGFHARGPPTALL